MPFNKTIFYQIPVIPIILNKMHLSLYKILILVFISLLDCGLHAQVTVDTSLDDRYRQARLTFPPFMRDFFQAVDSLDKEGAQFNVALVILEDIDTLNRHTLVYEDYSDIQIVDERIDSTLIRQQQEVNACRCDFMFSGQMVSQDTFRIVVGDLMGPSDIMHHIINGRVFADYHFYNEDMNNVKVHEDDPWGDEIKVPVRIQKFELSSLDFFPGNLIYGYCEMEVDLYFERETELYDNVLHLRRKMKYYFKFKVSDW